MPPADELPPYPPLTQSRLNLTLFPLDITTPHTLSRDDVLLKINPLIAAGSPLAEWVGAFLSATFDKAERLYRDEGRSVCSHDPVCVWYVREGASGEEGWAVKRGVDVRVETGGQWTRGMCVVDRRGMRGVEVSGINAAVELSGSDDSEANINSDNGTWLRKGAGNRVDICIATPGARALAPVLLGTIFGG